MTLVSIVLACLFATVLAIAVAFALHGRLLSRASEGLTCISTGLLLTLAVTHLLPEAFEQTEHAHAIGLAVWAGLMLVFIFEQLTRLHWSSNGGLKLLPTGVAPIVLGDSLHTFTDGLVIASSFLVSDSLGWAVAAGILMHELPQEVGDFVLLTSLGLGEKKAFRMLLLAGASACLGGILGYFVMAQVSWVLPYALALSAASFLYIALSELIPRLHKKAAAPRDAMLQLALMLVGSAVALLISIEH